MQGKTYSLFGTGRDTGLFYKLISDLADSLRDKYHLSEKELLSRIRAMGMKRSKLRRSRKNERYELMELLHARLHPFITGIEQHLGSVPLHKRITDPGLFTSREQYYLYMLEFELVNRMHRSSFSGAGYKLALLPYCLKGSQDDCRAQPGEVDLECRGCLKECYINRVSGVLRRYKVHPCIWSRTSLSSHFKKLSREYGSVSVLGIACLVELVMGMRKVDKAGVPVIGIPLNANRCPRWMGEMHDTSVDLEALEKLVEGCIVCKHVPAKSRPVAGKGMNNCNY